MWAAKYMDSGTERSYPRLLREAEAMTLAAIQHGYVYELLRKLGLSDFQASTGEFLLVRPLRVLLLVLSLIHI